MASTNPTPPLPRIKDEAGKVYGKLTVLALIPGGRRAKWLCRCACGATLAVPGASLRSGNTKSCSRSCRHSRHGQATRGQRSPEHRCWSAMRRRCESPTCKFFPNYGGRGILVCDRWKSFASFFADMGARPSPKHSIDRIDNNGHYEPDNCRWATKEEQDNNRRTNRLIEFQGETRSLTQWARLLGIHPTTMHLRLKNGWPVEKALTTPKQH
jgi:hypothetical protein